MIAGPDCVFCRNLVLMSYKHAVCVVSAALLHTGLKLVKEPQTKLWIHPRD